MLRRMLIGAVVACLLLGPAAAAIGANPSAAALQVALRAKGHYRGPVDGIAGPQTQSAIRILQRRAGLRPDGRVGIRTRRALGRLGRPLLGQRELWVGRVGWDVASLEFRLRSVGLPARAVDGRFTRQTARFLRDFQRRNGLVPDGIVGVKTVQALVAHAYGSRAHTQAFVHTVMAGEGFITIGRRYGVRPARLAKMNGLTLRSTIVPGQRLRIPGKVVVRTSRSSATHVVAPGEGFIVIADRYHVSPYDLAELNGLTLTSVLVPRQRLRVPTRAKRHAGGLPFEPPSVVRGYIDSWAGRYGVDPALARAVGWMESGFQPDVVSNVGAIGVMQLLPETWEFVDTVLLGGRTPRNAAGNVQAGVRYLRWQLDYFEGDVSLALAGWYQGARAVRERGIFDDTKRFVRVVLALRGTV